MKKTSILFLLICSIGFFSCGGETKTNDKQQETTAPVVQYTAEDTADIYFLVGRFCELMVKREYESVASVLGCKKGHKLINLPEDEQKAFIRLYTQRPLYAARIKSLRQLSNGFQEVGVLAQIKKDGDLENNIGVTTIKLHMVKTGDQWYMLLPSQYE